MTAYYNEIDPYAAAWLRNLIAAGLIAPGDVDERDIRDIQPAELAAYTQCHFFAGIGGWSRALRLAGWADDRPVWTGSCPCQPFSAAGAGGGFADERHLWPAWFHLIRELRPAIVFGEQVAAKAVEPWIDLVQSDMEGVGYAFAGVPVPAAGIGSPHIRDRLWWVADAASGGQREQRHAVGTRQGRHADGGSDASSGVADAERFGRFGWRAGEARVAGREETQPAISRLRDAGGVAFPAGAGSQGRAEPRERIEAQRPAAERDGGACGVADAGYGQFQKQERRPERGDGAGPTCQDHPRSSQRPGPLHGFWRDADWLLCRDGKWRPVEPGSSPLAHGIPARVGKLRAAGNAIVPQVAAEFIRTYCASST